MPGLAAAPPVSAAEAVTEMLHGVSVSDPYRWLEEQDSPRTRQWIEEQTRYARQYLDSLPGRDRIRKRVREFLAVETYDSLQKVGNRYFFRKRLPEQEQPGIYMREGEKGEDRLLIDPEERGTGIYTAVKPLRVSPDGRLLLYELKQGGERTGTFALFEIETRTTLADVLPRGYLRGFAFTPDGKSFYYIHEPMDSKRPFYRAARHHVLGTSPDDDEEVFCAGESDKTRLCLISEGKRLGFLVYRFVKKTRTDFYLRTFEERGSTQTFVASADCVLSPLLVPGKILALTDRNAPNFRIVELRVLKNKETEWVEIVPESDARINQWRVAGGHIFVSYIGQSGTRVSIFDLSGKKTGEMPVPVEQSVRFLGGFGESDELLFESESFLAPTSIWRYSETSARQTLWAQRTIPFDAASYSHAQVWYASKDGTQIPMFLLGRRDVQLAISPGALIAPGRGGSRQVHKVVFPARGVTPGEKWMILGQRTQGAHVDRRVPCAGFSLVIALDDALGGVRSGRIDTGDWEKQRAGDQPVVEITVREFVVKECGYHLRSSKRV